MPTVLSATTTPGDWTVVSLCAEWCRTCLEYRPQLAARAASVPDELHLWVDVEDEADALGDLDIETFPTLLVLYRDVPVFFGTVLPQLEQVDRLLQALRQREPAPVPVPPETAAAIRWLAQQARSSR